MANLNRETLQKIRVCVYISEPYSETEQQKHFIQLSRRLAKECELHIIAHPGYRDFFQNPAAFHSTGSGQPNWREMQTIAGYLQKIQPQIVHAYDQRSAVLTGIISLLHRFSALSTVHGFHSIATLEPVRMKRFWMRTIDLIICESRYQQNRMVGLPTRVIYRGYKNSESQFGYVLPKTYFNIAISGEDVTQYSIAALTEICKMLPVQLHVLGDTAETIRLASALHKSTDTGKVVFHGLRDDLDEIISACDLTLITDAEKSGAMLVRSLILQTAVISSDNGIAPEVLLNSHRYSPQEYRGLMRLVKYCIEHSTRLNTEFKLEYFRARRFFNMEKCVTEIKTVYSDLLDNSEIQYEMTAVSDS